MPRADPADIAARERSAAGLARQLGALRQAPPHPSRGGSTGYPVSQREQELAREQQGLPVAMSRSTMYRYRVNGVNPKRATGNRQREVLVGLSQIALAIILFAHPEASVDQIATFIYANTGEVVSRSQVSERMAELQISKKKASTEAYQAFTPVNMLRATWFWSQPPPLGVVTVRRNQFIDFDECAFNLEKTNRSTGHSAVGVRIRKPGHYSRDQKITLLMAIEPGDPALPPNVAGSVDNPRRWFRTYMDPGTTAERFADFCNIVCTTCENSGLPVDGDRVLLWDNLASHGAGIVYQTVVGRALPQRFRIIPRPPYQPKYGPIEYAFCMIGVQLREMSRQHWTVQHLEQAIHQVCAAIGRGGGFDRTFAHCGYQVLN
ncbi:hypothetical protein MPSEU_001030500 [Mayamaea pseudoterrestris]|nr:hypothetical protein MPSEU_001030500 [Mayamaea pseudoterrestris]